MNKDLPNRPIEWYILELGREDVLNPKYCPNCYTPYAFFVEECRRCLLPTEEIEVTRERNFTPRRGLNSSRRIDCFRCNRPTTHYGVITINEWREERGTMFGPSQEWYITKEHFKGVCVICDYWNEKKETKESPGQWLPSPSSYEQ